MYKNEDVFKNMLDLFANPLFRAGFTEFASKAQQEGMEAAKKFWGLSDYGKAFPYSEDMLERLADWYKVLGFVPTAKHKELMEENQNLKAENQLLTNMVKDMQVRFFSEGGEKAQQAWHDLIDKQLKVNAEVTSTFFEAIRQFKAGS
jgi:hypothetical protein